MFSSSSRRAIASLSLWLFFVLPASTTYELHDVGFGAGGTTQSESTSFGLTGTLGETAGQSLSGTSYDLGPGIQFTRQSNTPAAPTFTNPAQHYNKLQFILDTGSNPSDTLFAVAISSDSFATTNYLQVDNTIGATPVYQTYAAWGGASGAFAIGLAPSTTYSLKVRAVQTKFTESAFSQVATAATAAPSLSYDLDVSPTDSESTAPYTLSLGTLVPAAVTTATDKIWIDLNTNAEQGAFVYGYTSGLGLTSASAGYTITSVSGDLDVFSEGFGIRSDSTAQTTGGPLAAQAPYNSSGNTVGILNSTARLIFSSSNQPITGGRGSLQIKAKASTSTPAAADYSTILTLIASSSF